MSLNIKNDEAVKLARDLARATGESVTQAVSVAVRERLERLDHQGASAAADKAERIRTIAADAAPRWVEPYASTDHAALLYGDDGLPR